MRGGKSVGGNRISWVPQQQQQQHVFVSSALHVRPACLVFVSSARNRGGGSPWAFTSFQPPNLYTTCYILILYIIYHIYYILYTIYYRQNQAPKVTEAGASHEALGRSAPGSP